MIYLDIAQAKSNLVELLELAVAGQEIVITQDKAPVAKISPIQKSVQHKTIKKRKFQEKILGKNILDETLADLSQQDLREKFKLSRIWFET